MDERSALRGLARTWGVQASYTDATGRRRGAVREALVAVLRALGASLERASDAPAAWRERERDLLGRPLEPVVVGRAGDAIALDLRLPRRALPARLELRLVDEAGHGQVARARVAELRHVGDSRVDGEPFAGLRWQPALRPEAGYYRLQLHAGRASFASTLVVAPDRAHDGPGAEQRRDWGVFLPLYALHGRASWGAGNYADLRRLVDWTADAGGRLVGTLPLLPTFLDEPFEPSPYRPVSRLMWSEFFVAADEIDDLERAPAAQALRRSRAFRRRLAALRKSPTVDHRRQAELQRSLLRAYVDERLTASSAARRALGAFLREQPQVEDYARFRAASERFGATWDRWPERPRDGRLAPRDYEPATVRFHAAAQWLATLQLRAAAQRAAERGVGLYLDLPLGAHPAGYDVWRERELFATGVTAGAPPDAFFSDGQAWSFPPIRPDVSRAQGHRYFAACLRHHMGVASVLRIDHVMALHRLFWVPEGFGAEQGLYVRYPARELYAVLCLESSRRRTRVVGEDLGTVPREVRSTMRRRGLSRTFVLQHAQGRDRRRPLSSLSIEGFAGLRTHDMPTFAAFWRGLDVGRRLRLGHLDAAAARSERRARERLRRAWLGDLVRAGRLPDAARAAPREVLRACLGLLADGPAEALLLDLEDLWGESSPQNIPGTTVEYPNWRRKARHELERFDELRGLRQLLRELHRRREHAGGRR